MPVSFRLLPLLLVVACRKAPPQVDAASPSSAREFADGDRIRVEVDVDGRDGPEVISYYVEKDGKRRLVEKVADFEGDGFPELRSVYDENGNRVREDLNTDYDKDFDWVDVFTNGARASAEIDTDGNGKRDIRKTYNTDGTITKEWFAPKRGQETEEIVSQRLLLAADRRVICDERDTDLDGAMDLRACPGRAAATP